MRVMFDVTDPDERKHTMTERKGKADIIDVKALLTGDDAFIRTVVRAALQEVLEAEMTEAVGAGKGERTPSRMGYRSGYYVSYADDAGWQAGATGAAGSRRPLLDRTVRALSAFGAGAGSGVNAG